MKAYIPGWCYRSSVFDSIALNNNDAIFLDYPDLSEISLASVTEYFADKIDDGSHLVGWSLGGLFAISLAAQYPKKVQRLTLYGATPCFLAQDHWAGVSVEVAHAFLLSAQRNVKRLLKKFSMLVDFPNKNRSNCFVDSNSVCPMAYLKILLASDLRQQYADINAPIDFILGEKDAVVNVDPKALAALNANAKITVKNNASHAVFLEGLS